MDLYKYLYGLVSQIPKGKVSTYKALAEALGDVQAARAVGRILNENPKPGVIPCHRVVHSTGELGGYKFGIEQKLALLKKENIKIKNKKIKNFNKIIFTDFKTSYPLSQLRANQAKLAKQVRLEDRFDKVAKVAGVDVTYHNNLGIGVGVVLDYDTQEVLEIKIVKRKINFPYIATYLTFREFPVIRDVVSRLREKPDMLFIDGNGVLHPLGIGIATHAGIILNLPTIGVAKNLLCGEVEKLPKKAGESSRIFYNDKLVGFCLKSAANTKPIYISPGHKISFEATLKITSRFCRARIPEPIKLADKVGRRIRTEKKFKSI